ncbi:DUF5131 family protein [Streptomyces sp. NPDC058307]|uniref:DUF5131 family protein n=1 Tax=Streptomyces sp. NPDC058307 TaxID=3346439 RepID=UPI0036E2D0D5
MASAAESVRELHERHRSLPESPRRLLPGPSRRWRWRRSTSSRYSPRGPASASSAGIAEVRGRGLDRDGRSLRGRCCSTGQARARGRAQAWGQLERLEFPAASRCLDRLVGGESGPPHRPLDLARVRDIRDRCVGLQAALFFKQVGGPTPKAAGRLLDGRTWDEYFATADVVGAWGSRSTGTLTVRVPHGIMQVGGSDHDPEARGRPTWLRLVRPGRGRTTGPRVRSARRCRRGGAGCGGRRR